MIPFLAYSGIHFYKFHLPCPKEVFTVNYAHVNYQSDIVLMSSVHICENTPIQYPFNLENYTNTKEVMPITWS